MSILNDITESFVKPFFRNKDITDKSQTITDHPSITQDLQDNSKATEVYTYGIFSDNYQGISSFMKSGDKSLLEKQNDLIKEYRRLSSVPEVSSAIEEIVNEMSFVYNNEEVVYIDFSDTEMSDKLKEAYITAFKKIINKLNFNYNADTLVRRFYIDAKLPIVISYNKKDLKKGIQNIYTLDPLNLYYDKDTKAWMYYKEQSRNYIGMQTDTFSEEEFIMIDSGLISDNVVLSYLHPAIKVANQLQTLEDLLIPMRFSRSISRRVFNVDVGDLPANKVNQAITEIQNKFKYTKYYDTEKGTFSNSTALTSIVEDYYIPNRSGGKGTTIDVLDETGNLGETGDIDYFRKKLYTSLNVPLGRLTGAEKGNMFDFTATQIEYDEKRFFAFINRLRQRFNMLFIELLKREMISTGIMTEKDFNLYKHVINIKWAKENNFLERERLEIFKSKIDNYNSVKDLIGDVYSKQWVLKHIIGMSDEEIEEMNSQIKLEQSEDQLHNIGKGETQDNFEGGDESEETPSDNNAEEPEQPNDEESETPETEEPNPIKNKKRRLNVEFKI